MASFPRELRKPPKALHLDSQSVLKRITKVSHRPVKVTKMVETKRLVCQMSLLTSLAMVVSLVMKIQMKLLTVDILLALQASVESAEATTTSSISQKLS